MNTSKLVAVTLFLFVFSSNLFAGDCPTLSGEYTIGGNEGNYASIAEAVRALQCGGASGPVTFLIENGKYDERVSIGYFAGASVFNKVTFESKNGNNSEVIISSPSNQSDVTLFFNSATNISFENLTLENKAGTYGNVVKIDGNSENLSFKNVVFDGAESSRTGSNNAVIYATGKGMKNGISIQDCEINNGSVGVYKMSAESMDAGSNFSGNLFFNQYETGLLLGNENSPIISNNVISSLSSYPNYKALSLENCANNILVSNNIINATNGKYGLAMNNCEGLATNYGLVNNNSIAVGGNESIYGLYLSGKTDNQVLNFNRVKLTLNKAQASNQAYYKNAGSGNNINLMNNIFFDLNTGGYTIIGNTYKDFFNQLPSQSNPSLSVSANGMMIEKVTPVR